MLEMILDIWSVIILFVSFISLVIAIIAFIIVTRG